VATHLATSNVAAAAARQRVLCVGMGIQQLRGK
jgi:hypothetical protein